MTQTLRPFRVFSFNAVPIHRDVNRAHRHDKKAKLAQFAKNAKRSER